MKFNIRTKILLVFSLVITICIGAIIFNFILLNSLIEKTNYIFNTIDPIVEVAHDLRQSFNVDIRAIEAYGNGYIKDADTAEKIVKPSEDKINEDIKKIEASRLVPQENISSLKAILVRDEAADEKVFDLKKKTKENPKQHIISPEIYQAINSFDLVSSEVSQEIEKIIIHIDKDKKDYSEAFIDEVAKSKLYITAAFSVSITISILIVYITSLVFSLSIRKVRDAALKMSGGDLTQRVKVTLRDEIGDLANAFNQMAENIEMAQNNLKKVDEELETNNATLKEQDSKLKDQLEQLRKFQRITINREMKMIELKEKLKECERDHGKKNG